MTRENITNFATSTLLNPIGPADLSLTVATGGGALFPAVSTAPAAGTVGVLPYTPRPFVVCIDSEFLVISAVSGDTFTIQTRGFDGSYAASHAAGATVSIPIERDMLNRIWGALADRYNPDVPPFDQYTSAGAPNGYSDEFDSQSGLWTVYPLPSNLGGADTGASLDFSSTYRSHLFFQRLTASTTTYWLYQPISVSGATVFKWKWSHGLEVANLANTSQLSGFLRFFLSDQLNPTSAPWSGNSLGLGLGYDQSSVAFYPGVSQTSQPLVTPILHAAQSITNTYTFLGYASAQGVSYAALTCTAADSSGNRTWTFWAGDGVTWSAVTSVLMAFTPQSVGFRFELSNNNSATLSQAGAVDWFRVGTQLYGNN